jgi:phage baseplate assembly protein W
VAYNVRQISTLDLRPSVGIGVKIPFSSDSVFTTVYTTKEQLKYNMINYMLTDPGERPMNPNFGMGLRSRLFESITEETTETIKQSVQTQIEANFPNVQVRNVEILAEPNDNLITIQVSYAIRNSKETDGILLKIQNV